MLVFSFLERKLRLVATYTPMEKVQVSPILPAIFQTFFSLKPWIPSLGPPPRTKESLNQKTNECSMKIAKRAIKW